MSFLPYIDKENSSQLALSARRHVAAVGSGPVGKTFGGGLQQSSQTPLRRALGDVNTLPPANPTTKSAGIKFGSARPSVRGSLLAPDGRPAKPASLKPSRVRNVDRRLTSRKVDAVQPPKFDVMKMKTVPDREQMHVYEEPTDDFDDVWPVDERPATHLDRLRDMPGRILPFRGRDIVSRGPLLSDSDDSDIFADISVGDETTAPISRLMDERLASLDDIPLPPIDDLFLTEFTNSLSNLP